MGCYSRNSMFGGEEMAVTKIGLNAHLRKHAPRQGIILLLAIGFVALFYGRISALDTAAIWTEFKSVSPFQWVGALLATGLSFWAVGQYDAVVHRMMATGTGTKTAHRAGIAGIAVSQTLGMGVLTGALVRWRLLPEASLWQATRLSATVALSFLAGWAVVSGLVVALFAPEMVGGRMFALLPLLALVLLCSGSLMGRKITLFNRVFQLPSLVTISAILALTALDTVAAASALYILLPESISLPFYSLYPAFLLALGAALVSGTPGGVGPFEIALLALLPSLDAEPILGAVLAFRVVYYALPAIIGIGILARGPARDFNHAPKLEKPHGRVLKSLIQNAPLAEAGLLHQGHKFLLSHVDSGDTLMVSPTSQALVALRDPLTDSAPASVVKSLVVAAKNQGQIACFYKCSARIASKARQSGFTVLPIAREAWLDPCNFSTDTPRHRQLRRKLRKANAAGLTTEHASTLPIAEMARISSDWVARSGGERGFSMGVFTADYVRTQRCYLAMQNNVMVGFVTFNTCKSEWSLDLMRQSADAPDGTMYALLAHAIEDAKQAELPRLSMASIPYDHRNEYLRKCVDAASGGSGLRQFKSAFAPNWQTLYMAAPSRLSFCICAIDIAREITNKQPKPAVHS